MEVKRFRTKNSTSNFWSGFAKQTIDFQHALGELIDNALSATLPKAAGAGRQTAVIEVTIRENDDSSVTIQVADAGVGVSLDNLATDDNNIFNLGYAPPERGFMNEHGFGLKNALALMTSGFEKNFLFLSKPYQGNEIYAVHGPISDEMSVLTVKQEVWDEDLESLKGVRSGVKVKVDVKREYFNSLYQRGEKFDVLTTRLGEHLGVMYAHYIEKGNEIYFRYKSKSATSWIQRTIPAIHTPFLQTSQVTKNENTITLEVNGKTYQAHYIHGTLDTSVKLKDADQRKGWPYPLRIHFQGSNARCGVSFVVRDRTLKTGAFKEIWPDKAGDVSFNNFIAELQLSEDFQTTNNKNDLDPHSEAWQELLTRLQQEFQPEKDTKKAYEEGLRKKLIKIFAGVHSLSKGEEPRHRTVWGGSGDIDIFFEKNGNPYCIEVKVGAASVLDVYQLLMYWDGLVEDGKFPIEGILVAEDFPPNVLTSIDRINQRQDSSGKNYNLTYRKPEDYGL